MNKLLAGRYELIEKIGSGGMAVVYKAKCRLLNRYVAIKILRPEFTHDQQFVENFKRESQAAAGLQHPNIVSIYDVGREGDINYIVMELVDGRPLSEIIEEKGPLNYKVAINISKQVASALSLAHKNKVVHRDVKPHNIMITRDGIAKLGDFGIAKAVSTSTMVASDTNKVMGSVHYFSPEQAKGSFVDERTDIYSLGIVMYEMLTGTVPFDGENPVQVALMHINKDIIPPSQMVSGIPPTLEKIVLKATDKVPANRFRNADELIDALDNIEFVSKVMGNNMYTGNNTKSYIDVQPMNNNNVDYSQGLGNRMDPTALPVKNKSSNKRKKMWIAITSIVVALGVIVGGILYFSGFLGGNAPGGIKVPDLSGKTYEEASEQLEKLNLSIKKGDEVPSDEVGKGKVVSQTPLKGTKVKKGKAVTVNLSAGKKEGLVPSLINKQFTNADDIDKMLRQYGYRLGQVEEKESDVDVGVIIDQSPAAGKTAKKDTIVNIVVSKGKSKPKVPQLTGLTADDAKKALIDAGFQLGNTSFGESNVYKAGYVMEQQYPAGTELEKGKTIDLVIAKEPEKVSPVKPDQPKEPTPDNGNGSSDSDNGPKATE